MEIYTLLSH